MHSKFILPFLIAFAPMVSAQAPGGPPPGFFPQDMPNVGDLWIEFCYIGNHICVDQEARIWGQVCHSVLAADAAVNPTETWHPIWSHYAGWRCGKNGKLITPERRGFYNQGVFIESEAK